MKEFKLGITCNTTSCNHIPLENKLECLCAEFCKGNFMSMRSKIIDGAEGIVRL